MYFGSAGLLDENAFGYSFGVEGICNSTMCRTNHTLQPQHWVLRDCGVHWWFRGLAWDDQADQDEYGLWKGQPKLKDGFRPCGDRHQPWCTMPSSRAGWSWKPGILWLDGAICMLRGFWTIFISVVSAQRLRQPMAVSTMASSRHLVEWCKSTAESPMWNKVQFGFQEFEDLHIVITPGGVVKGKAIRRSSELERSMAFQCTSLTVQDQPDKKSSAVQSYTAYFAKNSGRSRCRRCEKTCWGTWRKWRRSSTWSERNGASDSWRRFNTNLENYEKTPNSFSGGARDRGTTSWTRRSSASDSWDSSGDAGRSARGRKR